jgi:hypothetical protein
MSTASDHPDPVEAEIEHALDPDRFVSDRAASGSLTTSNRSRRPSAGSSPTIPNVRPPCSETFLAGCYEKAEEVDDSSGSFGMFAQTLISGWITARQAAQASPQQTTMRPLTWMDNDQYGFCHRLEREIATVFDEAGLAAFIDQIRSRFEAVDLADRTGLTSDDCLTAANLLVTRGDPAQALSWVERGLELDTQRPHPSFAAHSLTELKPRLLADLGHDEQALETAWADYRAGVGPKFCSACS